MCREHELSASPLIRWRKEHERRGEAALPDRTMRLRYWRRRCRDWSDSVGSSPGSAPSKRGARGQTVADRHAMMAELHWEHPETSSRILYQVARALLLVLRSAGAWWQRPCPAGCHGGIVLAFPATAIPAWPTSRHGNGGTVTQEQRYSMESQTGWIIGRDKKASSTAQHQAP